MLLRAAATIAAAAVGFAVGGSEYRTALEWVVTSAELPPDALDRLRRDFLDHTWRTFPDSRSAWRVEMDPAARSLRLVVTSRDSQWAQAAASALTAGILQDLRARVERARAEPGPEEQTLAEFREGLRAERSRLLEELSRLAALVPRGDHEALEAQLRGETAAQRAVYSEIRRRVQEVEGQLTALSNTPLPDRAAVGPQAREQAIRADEILQQDLKALRVQIAETRHQLLEVWKAARPLLEELHAAGAQVAALCSGDALRSATMEFRRVVEQVAQSATDYSDLLAAFSQTWTAEFDRVTALEDDPRRAEVLEDQTAVEQALNTFLFQSSTPLQAIRDQVRGVASASGTAAHHELVSALLRAFQGFQTAHHRLEFAAADVKPANNFRLDAALKSARGLRQRTRVQLADIEERLARRALEELRTEREQRLAALQKEFHELRQGLDGSMEALLAVQQRADEHEPVVYEYVKSQATAGVYHQRLADLERELGRIDLRMNDLAAKRVDLINPDHIQMTLCRADPWPTNLRAKLLQGILAGVATLALLVGLQRGFEG